ncbi:MAG: phage tail sheath family protein [Oscillospiraceae bacterium]|jgi:hypothetical protein|nr:phage tail sheath family protein [Oscillospiraceae bacterium]
MAGGNFEQGKPKIQPGVYINTRSGRTIANTDGRGTVLLPLLNSEWGTSGTSVTVTAENPDASFAELGHRIYDDAATNTNSLLIREALKRAAAVIAYTVGQGVPATANLPGTDGENATPGLTITAAKGGSLGNLIKVVITEEPNSTFKVIILLGNEAVGEYKGLTTIGDLPGVQASGWVTFSGDAAEALVPTAGLNLADGTDAEANNDDFEAFLQTLDALHFDVICVPTADQAILTATLSKVRQLRDGNGKKIRAVFPNFPADYEGVTNVVNGYACDAGNLTAQTACAWVAGARAAAKYTQTLTFSPVEGATEVYPAVEDMDETILSGGFAFATDQDGTVVAYYDINSLVSFNAEKDERWRKNRILSVFDELDARLQRLLTPGKFDNDEDGFKIREGLITNLLLEMQSDKAIQNVDEENDVYIDRAGSVDDHTVVQIAIQPLDSTDKTYVTAIVK